MRLLVNNIEQVQPDHRNDTVIVLFGRSAENPAQTYRVNAYNKDPYFYVREQEARDNEDFLLSQECIRRIEHGVSEDAFIEDTQLSRVFPPYPQQTREARDLFDKHWNADVPFTNRFRIDSGLEDVVEVPEPTDEGSTTVECHWREIEPVVPADSGHEPRG
jgi:DNA polymerase elongation subunit (family B)